MAQFLPWIYQHWFDLLQAAGIVSSLVFTGLSLRSETHARRISGLLELGSHHRQLWSQLLERPELHRILQEELDLVGKPATFLEREFLNLVFVHMQTSWALSRNGSILKQTTLATDLENLARFPLFRVVWDEKKSGRDPEFIHFVEESFRMSDSRRN